MTKLTRVTAAVAASLFLAVLANPAEAMSNKQNGVTMLQHPPCCPKRAFCACGASYRVFGRCIRSLWPSSAWLRFPRDAAASGNVAVRRGHVFVLESHVSGRDWLVSDYNSGGHKSRRHIRSIAGYTIVNPHGHRSASLAARSRL